MPGNDPTWHPLFVLYLSLVVLSQTFLIVQLLTMHYQHGETDQVEVQSRPTTSRDTQGPYRSLRGEFSVPIENEQETSAAKQVRCASDIAQSLIDVAFGR